MGCSHRFFSRVAGAAISALAIAHLHRHRLPRFGARPGGKRAKARVKVAPVRRAARASQHGVYVCVYACARACVCCVSMWLLVLLALLALVALVALVALLLLLSLLAILCLLLLLLYIALSPTMLWMSQGAEGYTTYAGARVHARARVHVCVHLCACVRVCACAHPTAKKNKKTTGQGPEGNPRLLQACP